ncbi:hypothetical protein [Siccirubricoccus sp. G192]|uniref:hypothetical protein n=1 Tax=Siccirubricoccus sp. G192 TaxID=2849651 RepID=UPI001C2BAF0F|nr:hypothetical protein [Siccirubricoccus sp. G192]MBV1795678.1 hypothetical protein [Siccirubricoccus sp. G192]
MLPGQPTTSRRGGLLAGAVALTGAALAGTRAAACILPAGSRPPASPPDDRTAQAGWPPSGKAGLLITGQSNAGLFLHDGGIWIMNQGLAALLGIGRAYYDPRLDGLRRLDGYALREGAHRNPDMATTYGGRPLWAPGDDGAFLVHQPGMDPSLWQQGFAGRSLDRFLRELLTARDRAECLGILWIHTEADSRGKRMGDVATHAAAIRRHIGLIRAAFGRPATGPGELPAYGWSPIPYGDSAEGHRAVRAALAEVVADPSQNFRLAIPQTGDSEPRDGQDWSHRDAPDLRLFARRAAYAIAWHQRVRCGPGLADLPGPGPRISLARAESPATTMLTVDHDQGRRLKASRAARDGRGWSVLDQGASRAVTAMELMGTDRILLRHEPCLGGAQRRAIGYCLHGEQVGRGNAVTDDWSAYASLPPGLGADWRFDFPLQATLLPIIAGEGI